MENTPSEKIIPTGVKIFSVLYYIGAVSGIIAGIFFFVGAGLMDSLILNQFPFLSAFGFGSMLFVVGGVLMLILGVLNFFIGRGLWKGKNWARILLIIFSLLGILISIFIMIQGSLMSGILSLLINGLIGSYFLFNTKVKEAFAKPIIS